MDKVSEVTKRKTPSEMFKVIKELEVEDSPLMTVADCLPFMCEKVEQALTERQDLEKFTRLVVEKNVDILTLNSWFSKGIGDLKTYNYDLEDKDKLTEEEFTFIKGMIAKYGKQI